MGRERGGWEGEGRVVIVEAGVGGMNEDSGEVMKPPPSSVIVGEQ